MSKEIAAVHHPYLNGWVRYRAYPVPDTDFMDKDRSARGLSEFEVTSAAGRAQTIGRDNNANRRIV